MTLQERLLALLNDPRTRKAAARVAQDFKETDDGRQLELAVEAIEMRRRELDELEAEKAVKRQSAHARVRELLAMRIPQELMSDLLEDVEGERFEEAHRKADAIRDSFEKIRRGQPGLQMVWRGVWNDDIRYEPGDSVRYLGIAYVCLAQTLDRPALDGKAWMPLLDPYTLAAYVSGGGGGTTDHGSLSGLGDDDHPQYLTQAEADALYDPLGGGGGGSVATDSIWAAKGDLIVGTANDTAAILGVGSNDQVPFADSAQSTGLQYRTVYVQVPFTKTGNLSTGTGTTRWYNDTGRTLTIDSTRGSVGTAPTTQSILVDVNINGTSIWASTQANRITIAAGTNTDQGGTPDDATIANGEYLTVDIDQVGSGTVGADLTVQIWMKG